MSALTPARHHSVLGRAPLPRCGRQSIVSRARISASACSIVIADEIQISDRQPSTRGPSMNRRRDAGRLRIDLAILDLRSPWRGSRPVAWSDVAVSRAPRSSAPSIATSMSRMARRSSAGAEREIAAACGRAQHRQRFVQPCRDRSIACWPREWSRAPACALASNVISATGHTSCARQLRHQRRRDVGDPVVFGEAVAQGPDLAA